MRYPKEHKARVREKIVVEAARQFRRFGYAGVSIDALMAKAGLTRGGFYGYFRSKAALFADVIRSQHEFVERLRGRTADTEAELVDGAVRIASDYVSPTYRRGVIKGCGIAALAMETCRSPVQAKRAYASSVRDLIEEFQRGLPGAEPLDRRAIEAILLSVGGLLLANASDPDTELADRISAVAQAAIADALGRESEQVAGQEG